MIMSSFYFNGDNLMILIREVNEQFWRFEQFDLKEDDEIYFRQTGKNIKMLVKILVYGAVITIVVFYLPPVFFNKELPFKIHKPSLLTDKQMLSMQLFSDLCTAALPVTSAMSLLMTFCNLTKLQFRLVNREIERILNIASEVKYGDIQKILDHYNFLLR